MVLIKLELGHILYLGSHKVKVRSYSNTLVLIYNLYPTCDAEDELEPDLVKMDLATPMMYKCAHVSYYIYKYRWCLESTTSVLQSNWILHSGIFAESIASLFYECGVTALRLIWW